MTDPTDTGESMSPNPQENGKTARRTVSRRRMLATAATAGSVSLTGCLSLGPTVKAYGLANSLVFKDVQAAETFSFGGNRLTVSVYLKPKAHNRLGVKELKVFTTEARPYSAADADTPPGSFSTGYNIPVAVPVDEPAVISAIDEHNTMVESINVTNDATTILAGLGAKPQPKQLLSNQTDMPAKILTTSFEQRDTQFSTDAWMNAKVKNTARDAAIPYLAVEAAFTNSTREVVDRTVENIGLSASEVWDTVVPVFGDASNVASGKLTIIEASPGKPPVPPTNVTVLEDSLKEPDEELEPLTVVGKLRNTGTKELPFLEAGAKFYAENGDVFGENAVTVTGLNAGKTWTFEIPFYAHSTERAERVAEYELSFVS